MKITFGMSLDSYRPPKHKCNFGEVVIGPNGLLDILETRLGLSGVWPAQSIRVVQYQQCLIAVDNPERFYSQSLSVDALAVAKELLTWRDEWISAGWDGAATDTDSKRIQDMAAVEDIARDQLGVGEADRLRSVIEKLDTRSSGIDEIELIDAIESLPPMWQVLLSKLSLVISPIDDWKEATADLDTDLGALQHSLLTNSKVSFKGDGSFFILEASSDHVLSLGLAVSFAESNTSLLESTTIISGKEGVALDEGLQSRDLPISGQTNISLWRPASQVMPLFLSLVWAPLNPHRLLKFLTHPVCPLRQPLRSRLARVVAQKPGIGGDDWNKVVAKARKNAIDNAGGDLKEGIIIDEMIDNWLIFPRYDSEDGAPISVLVEHCSKIARWAARRISFSDISDEQRLSFLIAHKQALIASETIDKVGKPDDTLSQLQLESLIEEVMASGSSRPDIEAEKGCVHVASQASSVINCVDRVVWWDFSAPAFPQKWPWSPAEIIQLRSHGVHLPNVDVMLQHMATTWLRPVMAAKRQIILVMPQRRRGKSTEHHPLWDQFLALLPDGEQIPTLNYESQLEIGESHPWLYTEFEQVEHRELPGKQRWWHLKSGELLTKRDVESYSTLVNFLNTPHRWVLDHKAKLSKGSLVKISEDNRQKGLLAHRLFEWLFSSKEIDWHNVDKPSLIDWIDDYFPVLLEQEGANYLLLGKARQANELKMTIVSSAWALIGYLRESKSQTVDIEVGAKGDYCGGRLRGRIDMLISNEDNMEVVLDIKWGGFENYYCPELIENRQLQLAIYAVLRKQAAGKFPEQAYYILSEARLAAQNNDYFNKASVCEPDDEAVNSQTLWVDFETTWKWRRQQLDNGLIELNVEGTEPDDNSIPPDGALSIKGADDKFEGYISLIGWPEGS